MSVPYSELPGFWYRQLLLTPPAPKARFDNQVVIVTGSNVGLGLEAARHFAQLGARRVILAVRDEEKGEVAKKSIEQTLRRLSSSSSSSSSSRSGSAVPETEVSVWKLDLSSYASVKAFANRVEKELDRLDVLCANAGIATGVFRITEQDESTITTNVVSTFLLAFLVLPKMKETARRFEKAQPTISIVSSEVHAFTTFPERHEPNIFLALSDPSKANMADRYFLSKLLELLIVREIASSSSSPSSPSSSPFHSSGVTLNCLNPGFCHSQLGREAGLKLKLMAFFLARSTVVGARTLVAAAQAGPESHGKYMSEGVVVEPSAWVRSEEGGRIGRKVWGEVRGKLEGEGVEFEVR